MTRQIYSMFKYLSLIKLNLTSSKQLVEIYKASIFKLTSLEKEKFISSLDDEVKEFDSVLSDHSSDPTLSFCLTGLIDF